MSGSNGRLYLTAKRLKALLEPLQDEVQIVPTAKGLLFRQGDTFVGGLSFRGDGEIVWYGPD